MTPMEVAELEAARFLLHYAEVGGDRDQRFAEWVRTRGLAHPKAFRTRHLVAEALLDGESEWRSWAESLVRRADHPDTAQGWDAVAHLVDEPPF